MGKYRCRVITPGWSASDMIFLSLVKPRKFTDHASHTLAMRNGLETGGIKTINPLPYLAFPDLALFSCLPAIQPASNLSTSPPTNLSSPAAREPRRACSRAILPSALLSITKSHALLDNFPLFLPLLIPFKLPPPAFQGSYPLSSSSLCHSENVNANIKASLSRQQSTLPTKSM